MTTTHTTPAAPGAERVRLVWPDLMRAACVYLIVVFHIQLWLVETTGLPGVHDVNRWWDLAHGLLDRVRLAGLLLLSGMLVSRRLLTTGRTAIDLTSVRRAVSSYYLYVVWLVIYWAVFAAAAAARPSTRDYPHAFTSAGDAAGQLVVPDTTLWYLYALACYVAVMIVVVRLRVPAPVVILAAVALSVLASGWESWAANRIGFHLLFFVIGVYLGPRAAAMARMSAWWLAPAAAVFGSVTVLGIVTDVDAPWFAVVARLASIPVVLVVCVLLSRLAPVARLGSFVGRRTLSVYVLHPLLLIPLWWWVTEHHDAALALASNPAGLALLLYGGGAVTAGLALLVETGLRRVRAGALFALPDAVLPQRAEEDPVPAASQDATR